MLADAMNPFGKALLDYHSGETSAEIILERDDGFQQGLPMSIFFRTPDEFIPIERRALDLCRGRVLDIGAGSGLHALALQERGLDVTAMDISPEAVEVMTKNGVKDVRCADIFSFDPEPYDTLLLMGHGIGMVENLTGLDRFLKRMKGFLNPGGQILLTSLNVSKTDDPRHLAYHDANRNACRYIGEIRIRILYKDIIGEWYTWLQVDASTLKKHAVSFGWKTHVVMQEEDGNYLARLLPADLHD